MDERSAESGAGWGGDERNGEAMNRETDRQQYNGQWGNDNTIREEDRKGEMEGGRGGCCRW